jgi:hypothetical protein
MPGVARHPAQQRTKATAAFFKSLNLQRDFSVALEEAQNTSGLGPEGIGPRLL